MNRKQFLILVIILVVLGGAGLALFWQDIANYRESGARIGAKLLPEVKIAEVAQVRLKDAHQEVTLVSKGEHWVVQERGDYPANVQDISALLVKLIDLKVTQAETVGSSLWPRVELVAPGQAADGAASGDKSGVGTLVEFKDKSGKMLASLVLGKKVLKKDPLNPLPNARDGVPAGRYIRLSGAQDKVVVVSDPLNGAEAQPGKWLAKDFFKVDRIRTLAVGPEGAAPNWKITRDVEWGQWKLGGGGDLDASNAVRAANALGDVSFTDVALKPGESEKPFVAVAETFDDLTYRVTLARKPRADEYYLRFTVSGEPARKRVPEKDEKPEERARRDKDYAETLKRLEERIAKEKGLAQWTYVVARPQVEPLLKSRAEMIAHKERK
jgi:hypothetical protein